MSANETIDITQIPTYVNDAFFGGDPSTEPVAGMAVAAFILLLVMMPMIYARAKPASMVIVGVVVLGVLSAIGWMPGYVMLALILICAALLATKAGDWLGG